MQEVESMLYKYVEGIFIAVLLLFSFGMFLYSFTIVGLSSATDNAGPALMPKLVFGTMTIFTTLLAFDYAVRMRVQKEVQKDAQERRIVRNRGLISICGILVFVFLIDKIGFLLSSILYLFTEIYLLGPKANRRPLLWITITILFCVAVYYLFRYQVYVRLPKGILG